MGRIFQIDKLYLKGKVQGCIFAITKDEDHLQNPVKQAKVRDLERQIDPVRWLLSNGVDHMVYKLYDLTPEEIAIIERRK